MAVYAIYAFCRQADDTVDADEPIAIKKEKLDQLEEALISFTDGQTADHPMWRALRDVFDRFDMDVSPFFDQIEGQRRDLDFKEIMDMDDLKAYSYYVAGSVGLMLLPILANQDAITPDLRDSAVSLGIAMQLTNILRDVGEDYRDNHRVYLPSDRLAAHDVYLDIIMKKGPDQAFITMWEEIAQESEAAYDSFIAAIDQFDSDCQLAVLTSANVYRGILDSVRAQNYDCINRRNYVSELKMVQLVLESKKQLKKKK